ncbi:MAG: [Clostridia bacterium]|nr:[citrate (pro-3S)-lyase] ligase [Clostridia bacterium]
MDVELVRSLRGTRARKRDELLALCGLVPDGEAEETCLVWDGEELCATGARVGNLLKFIAVSPRRQGEGLLATLISALRQSAFSAGEEHLFLYTKPENRLLFADLFFYPVAETDKVLLMEDQREGIASFLESLALPPFEGVTGAAVMNCNPFTLGHRYLVEEAKRRCDRLLLFVLSEDKSEFSAGDRMEMVRRGVADLEGVTVLPTGPYLISSATFPTYFLKDRDGAAEVQCLLDIDIFCRYFAPRFGITRRFVGQEPFSPMTARYNESLKEQLPLRGIELFEIPRREVDGTAVSASAVRRALAAGDKETVRSTVPPTTLDYLQTLGLI